MSEIALLDCVGCGALVGAGLVLGLRSQLRGMTVARAIEELGRLARRERRTPRR